MHKDLIVIGAGVAGTRLAVTAARQGVETLLIGSALLDGALCSAGSESTHRLYQEVVSGSTLAEALRAVRDEQQATRSLAHKALQSLEHLTFVSGSARFLSARVVEVDGTQYAADHIVVATGAKTFLPSIPGIDQVPWMTPDSLAKQKRAPKHLIILGGGALGCEYASLLSLAGVKVTLVERNAHIASSLPEDVRSRLVSSLTARGVRIITGVATTGVSHKKQFSLSLSGADVSRISADALLLATGRVPQTESLELSRAGVSADGRGFITVDARLRSTNTHVYALGECTGTTGKAAAFYQSWMILEHIFFRKRTQFSPQHIPWAVYTEPMVAGVGTLSSRHKSLTAQRQQYARVAINKGSLLGGVVMGAGADAVANELSSLMLMGSGAENALRSVPRLQGSSSEILNFLS